MELAQTPCSEQIPSSSVFSGTSTAFAATLPTALTPAEGPGSSPLPGGGSRTPQPTSLQARDLPRGRCPGQRHPRAVRSQQVCGKPEAAPQSGTTTPGTPRTGTAGAPPAAHGEQQGKGHRTPYIPPGAAPSQNCEIQIPTRANPDLADVTASSLPCQLPFPSLQVQRPVNSTMRA